MSAWSGAACRYTKISFQIKTPDGSEVGKVSKKWTGFAQEMFTDADTFQITFPQNLDINTKATLLGFLFLIVSTYT